MYVISESGTEFIFDNFDDNIDENDLQSSIDGLISTINDFIFS